MSSNFIEQVIKSAITEFSWDNFGLDEVGDADPQYAAALASEIAAAIGPRAGEDGAAFNVGQMARLEVVRTLLTTPEISITPGPDEKFGEVVARTATPIADFIVGGQA